MNIFSPESFYQPYLVAIIRIITGSLLVFHGAETFDPDKMNMYTGWFVERKYAQPAAWAYAGKISELLIGIAYVLGVMTRVASFACMLTFAGIIVLLGDSGKIFEGDQHPFLFILLALMFIATGPGAWSLDRYISKWLLKNR